MSEKEYIRRKIAKEVMRKAWFTFKNCMLSWRTCLIIRWRTVRFLTPIRHTKIRGTTFNNRQEILRRLSQYPVRDIRLSFLREPDNAHDTNAIVVMATVRNKGSAGVGYLSREISSWLAPIIDSGGEIVVMLSDITGVNREGSFLGMNLEYIML
ncbi:MAG: HIRAN domain-containing protein [Clostridiaceae bacterium]